MDKAQKVIIISLHYFLDSSKKSGSDYYQGEKGLEHWRKDNLKKIHYVMLEPVRMKSHKNEDYQDEEESSDDFFKDLDEEESFDNYFTGEDDYDVKENLDDFFKGQSDEDYQNKEESFYDSLEDSGEESSEPNDDYGVGSKEEISKEENFGSRTEFGSGENKSSEKYKSQEITGSGEGDGDSSWEKDRKEEHEKRKGPKESGFTHKLGGGIIIISRPEDSSGNVNNHGFEVNVESCQGAKRLNPCNKEDKRIRTMNGECNNLKHR